MKVGPVLREIRRSKGLTLGEVASDAGLSVSHLSLIERDEREPSLSALDALGAALGVPPAVVVLLAARQRRVPEVAGRVYAHLEAIARLTLKSRAAK